MENIVGKTRLLFSLNLTYNELNKEPNVQVFRASVDCFLRMTCARNNNRSAERICAREVVIQRRTRALINAQ